MTVDAIVVVHILVCSLTVASQTAGDSAVYFPCLTGGSLEKQVDSLSIDIFQHEVYTDANLQ